MENQIIWNYCRNCVRDTKHKIVFKKSVPEYVPEGGFDIGNNEYMVLECNGCECISFRQEYHDYSDIYENEQGKQVCRKDICCYPFVLINHRSELEIYYLPEKIKNVYEQTILALKGGSNLLAGVGFRAIIEAICQHEKIKGHNLELKINALAKNRFITDKEAERLHPIRFLGNDAVHDMEIPSTEKLLTVLHIIEHLLENLYILDSDAKRVLDTIVKDYPDFEQLFLRCVCKCAIGETKTLKEILTKNIRRISADTLKSLEAILVEKIKSERINSVSICEQPNNMNEYCYTIRSIEEPLPF
jgi:hypothetical protein